MCNIQDAGWKLVGSKVVETNIGPFSCSRPVQHHLEVKTVRKGRLGWRDETVTRADRPETGPDFQAKAWTHRTTIRGTGTYHVHVLDIAEAENGQRQRLIDKDTPDFECDEYECRRKE